MKMSHFYDKMHNCLAYLLRVYWTYILRPDFFLNIWWFTGQNKTGRRAKTSQILKKCLVLNFTEQKVDQNDFVFFQTNILSMISFPLPLQPKMA